MNNRNFKKSISLRCDKKVNNMLDELQEELLLNTSSILRVAIKNLYKEKIEERDIYGSKR